MRYATAVKIALLGAQGQVGRALAGPLATLVGTRGELRAWGRTEVDLEVAGAVAGALDDFRPDLVINAAAFTHVDHAEKEPARATRINAEAMAELGRWAVTRVRAVVHLSTDYVFDGTADRPYRPDDSPAPINHYGRTKLAGERALLDGGAAAVVLRVAWVYSLYRGGFLSRMMHLAEERPELRVVADQTGSPTSARDLATAIALIVRDTRGDPVGAFRERRGVYHLAGRGACTRWAFIDAAVRLHPRRAALAVETIVPASSEAFPTAAARPRYSALDNATTESTFGVNVPPWREGLARTLHDRFGRHDPVGHRT